MQEYLASETNRQIKAYLRDQILDKHLTTCLMRLGEKIQTEKLKSFFGISEEEIITYFYRKRNQATLFGEEEIIQKISDPIEKIAELYTLRLKTIWSHVTEKPLRLLNSKGVPIYHFVFASNNPTGVKIAKDIISTKK
jgi:hypothetical protein